MASIHEAFEPLAEAFKRQFGVDLDAEGTADNESELNATDGLVDGVKRVGSVKSNWLKRNAPKFGFTRKGDSATFSWNGDAVPAELAAPVAAEQAEIEAVSTVTDAIPDEALGYTAENLEQEDIADEFEPEHRDERKNPRRNRDR